MLSFDELLAAAPRNLNIYNSLLKTRSVLERHGRIAVSISGGSDSDCILDLLRLVKPNDCELVYVFFDTGLEFSATKRHLDELETKYGITIERRRAETTVAAACRRHGVPFLCKDVSEFMDRLQTHGFDWRDCEENATPEKYGKCKSALGWYFDRRPPSVTGKAKYSINKYFMLRNFIIDNPPDFKISNKCCNYAKKAAANEFNREFNPDLSITGMRRAEGGRRAGSIASCFTLGGGDKPDSYRPIWYWTDADKAVYKEWRGLRYSDCYEVWNLKRTGCAGCTCNSKAEQELAIIEQYEPQLVKAARNIFGAAYDYRRRYVEYKDRVKAANKQKAAKKADAKPNEQKQSQQATQ